MENNSYEDELDISLIPEENLFEDETVTIVSPDDYDTLNEITIDKGGKYGIEVDGPGFTDNGFSGTPYFKIYKGQSNFKTVNPKNRVRVAIKDAKYVYHTYDPGNWDLNNKEKLEMINMLKAPCKEKLKQYKFADGYTPQTNWEAILSVSNTLTSATPKDNFYFKKDTPMPDYLNDLR